MQSPAGDESSSSLHDAIGGRHLSTVRLLVRLGADVSQKSARGDTPLAWAEGLGEARIADWLLDNGASLEDIGRAGSFHSPLHLAAIGGDADMVEVFLRHGADPNARADNGDTALHIAVRASRPAAVAALLKGGAEADVRSEDGWYPLHMAAWTGNRRAVEVLLAAGADVTRPWIRGDLAPPPIGSGGKDVVTPVDLAAESGDATLVKTLLQNGGEWTFRAAVLLGRADLVKEYIEQDASITELEFHTVGRYDSGPLRAGRIQRFYDPMSLAALHGHADLVRLFLKLDRFQRPLYRYSAVCEAAGAGRVEILEILLEGGLDPDAEFPRSWPLLWAARGGEKDAVDLLLKKGAKVNGPPGRETEHPGPSPLEAAASAGHADVTFQLVNAAGDAGFVTAVNSAARRGHLDLVRGLIARKPDRLALTQGCLAGLYSKDPRILELILKSGGDPNEPNAQGDPPLIKLAVTMDSILSGGVDGKPTKDTAVAMANLLLDHGAAINDPSENEIGRTALHWAIAFHHWRFADVLLQRRADPNIQDPNGQTPLHVASSRGDLLGVRLLLSKGADPTIRDKSGRSPRDYAEEKGYELISDELFRASRSE